MRDEENYTAKALRKSGKTVKNYKRQEINGVIEITYDLSDINENGAPLVGEHEILSVATTKSHYFDAKTGELLGDSRNEASEKLNNKGCDLFQKGNYSQAAEYHNNAYQICSSGYENKQKFMNDKNRAVAEVDAMNLNFQGDISFFQGLYAAALDKYQEAYNKSQVPTECKNYTVISDRALAEIDAINLNSEGDDLFRHGLYESALRKYQEAYNKSQVTIESYKYTANSNRANAEVDATHLNSQGDFLFNRGKYGPAHRKYQEAYYKSQVTTERKKYAANIDKACTEISAFMLSSEGDYLFLQGRYQGALQMYKEAYDKSQVSIELDKYKTNYHHVRDEIDATKLSSKGDNFFFKGLYESAIHNYQKAYKSSQVSKERNKYIANNDRALAEIDAKNLNYEGDDLFRQGLYAAALWKYEEACNKSQVKQERNKYTVNIAKANVEIDAIEMCYEGDDLFLQGKYGEALSKYQEAYKKSQITKERNIFRDNINRAQAKIDAISSNHQGN